LAIWLLRESGRKERGIFVFFSENYREAFQSEEPKKLCELGC
jgi:hypothetical protein